MFFRDTVNRVKRHSAKAVFALLALLAVPAAQANFQLETMTVILNADEDRKVFSVKNTSKEPILLSTKIQDIPGGDAIAKDIMISPPIIRIEPQGSQQINFILKKGVSLPHEAMLKVSFQGVSSAKQNVTKMPIRQDVAMLVVPKGLVESQKPWENLKIEQSGNQLTLTNSGKQVVRLSPNFVTLPDNQTRSIGQLYLRPGESRAVNVEGPVKEIKLSPLSRYGFKSPTDVTMPVSK